MFHRYKYLSGLYITLWFVITHGLVNAASPDQKGLLWKIERDGAKSSYLLGTMHSEDSRVLKLAPAVQRAFDSSASFTMEVVLDMQAMIETAQTMTLTDGRDLKKNLGNELFAKVVPLMAARGIPESILTTFKPWAIFLTLSVPQQQTGEFLDSALHNAAVKQSKKVYGLETVREQLDIFDRMTTIEQVRMVEDAVKHHAEQDQALEEMITAYLKRDLAILQAVSDKYMMMDDTQLANKLMVGLIDVRNRRMLDRMAPRLREGNAFIAVGALHLPGEQGLLRLLERQGYRVSAVY